MVKFLKLSNGSVEWWGNQCRGTLLPNGELTFVFHNWSFFDYITGPGYLLGGNIIETSVHHIKGILDNENSEYIHYKASDVDLLPEYFRNNQFFRDTIRVNPDIFIHCRTQDSLFFIRENDNNIRDVEEVIDWYNENFKSGRLTKGTR